MTETKKELTTEDFIDILVELFKVDDEKRNDFWEAKRIELDCGCTTYMVGMIEAFLTMKAVEQGKDTATDYHRVQFTTPGGAPRELFLKDDEWFYVDNNEKASGLVHMMIATNLLRVFLTNRPT